MSTKKTKAKPKISRQLAWQRKQRKDGRCWRCGSEMGKSPYKVCVVCAEADRRRQRKKDGTRPWKPGGRGRPPIVPPKVKTA